MANLYLSYSGTTENVDAILASLDNVARRGNFPPARFHYARAATETDVDGNETFAQLIVQADFTQEEQDQLAGLGFVQQGMYPVYDPSWKLGQQLAINDVVLFDNLLYRVIQAHTTQADWTPTATPALFTRYYEPSEIPEWVQPQGAHDAYPLDFQVMHNGFTWKSLIPANVWEPGAVGSEALWENLTPPPAPGEWRAGVAYTGDNTAGTGNGNVVTYLGHTYRCLQSHISISTWHPDVVPALWTLLT